MFILRNLRMIFMPIIMLRRWMFWVGMVFIPLFMLRRLLRRFSNFKSMPGQARKALARR